MTVACDVPITLEPLSGEAFAPFGQLVTPPGAREPDFVGYGSTGWDVELHISGRPQLLILRNPFLGLRAGVLERHAEVTQAVFALTAVPAALIVARPGPDGGAPRLEDVRAFRVDGGCGYVLHRETWHAPDRYPLYPPGADYALLTEWETTSGDAPDRDGRTEIVDCEGLFGGTLLVTLATGGQPR